MRFRLVVSSLFVLALSACGGGSAASAPAPTSGTGPGGTALAAPTATGTAPSGAIDLSGLDACTLLDVAVVEALTGESGFRTSRSDGGPSGDKCFWGTRAPQYVEVTVSRTNALLGFDFGNFGTVSGCTEIPVTAAGVEAVGADCTSPQHKVFVRAWASGVQVEVLVNEPKGALTPQDLADRAKTIFDGLQ